MINRTTIQTNIRGAVNCWLRYVLSQPIDIDLYVAIIFVKQYFGVPGIKLSIDRAREEFNTLLNSSFFKRDAEVDAIVCEAK